MPSRDRARPRRPCRGPAAGRSARPIAAVEQHGEAPGLNVAQGRDGGERRAPVSRQVDVADGAAEPVGLVVVHQPVDQRLAGHDLHLRVERRANRQAALVELLLAVALGELATHLLGEIAGRVAVGREHARVDAEGLGLGLVGIGLGDVAVLRHALQNVVATIDSRVPMQEGLVIVGTLRQARQVGDLGDRQFVDRLVEVVERRGRHAVVAEPEIDLVEIELEDLLLGVGLLDPQRQQGFADLAAEAPLVGQEEVLGHLLGDGRGALGALAALDQHAHGAQDALGIHAVMRVEILVLRRDEGLLHQGRNGGRGQVEPSLAGIFGQQAAIARLHAGQHGRLVFLELGVVRQILLEFPHRHGRHAGDDDEHQRAGGEQETKEPGDMPHRETPREQSSESNAAAGNRPPRPLNWRSDGGMLRLFCGANAIAAAPSAGTRPPMRLLSHLWRPRHNRRGRGCVRLQRIAAGPGGAADSVGRRLPDGEERVHRGRHAVHGLAAPGVGDERAARPRCSTDSRVRAAPKARRAPAAP